MPVNVLARLLFAASICIPLLTSGPPAFARSGGSQLTSAQILKPDALTAKELAYYKKLTDPDSAKNFIETRSYVRLAQKVVAHEMPAQQLPEKPSGFSRAYLLPGEEALIDKAIEASLVALMKEKIR